MLVYVTLIDHSRNLYLCKWVCTETKMIWGWCHCLVLSNNTTNQMCFFVAFLQMVWLFRWMEQKHSYVHWSNSYKYHLLVSVIERLQRHGSKWGKLLMNVYEFLFWSYSKVFSTSSQNIPNWLKLLILLPQALTSTSNLRHHQLGLPDAKGTTFSSAKPSVAIPHLGGAGGFSDVGF